MRGAGDTAWASLNAAQLAAIVEKWGDERRTKIIPFDGEVSEEQVLKIVRAAAEAQVDELVGILRQSIEAAMADLRQEGLLAA